MNHKRNAARNMTKLIQNNIKFNYSYIQNQGGCERAQNAPLG